MKKKILFLHSGRMSGLPPFLSLIDYLLETNLYEINVLSAIKDVETHSFYQSKGVKIAHFYEEIGGSIKNRVINKIHRDYLFKNWAIKSTEKTEYDILWVISERTAVALSDFLEEKLYILSVYELNDRNPKLLQKLEPLMNNAKVNVVCEYNRSQIMRVWFKLKENPIVLPNKPYKHPLTRYVSNIYENQLKDKKVILYQGHISIDRNLEGICAAVTELEEYKLVLMGDGGDYIQYLKKKYPRVLFIDYVKAPSHLKVTSFAHIGIVTYDYYSLNTIYCAPNKIWEYSGFGIPMLANDIPCLRLSVNNNKAGITIDMDNPHEIKKAILQIEENYQLFSKNAQNMFDSCQIGKKIDAIIEKYLE